MIIALLDDEFVFKTIDIVLRQSWSGRRFVLLLNDSVVFERDEKLLLHGCGCMTFILRSSDLKKSTYDRVKYVWASALEEACETYLKDPKVRKRYLPSPSAMRDFAAVVEKKSQTRRVASAGAGCGSGFGGSGAPRDPLARAALFYERFHAQLVCGLRKKMGGGFDVCSSHAPQEEFEKDLYIAMGSFAKLNADRDVKFRPIVCTSLNNYRLIVRKKIALNDQGYITILICDDINALTVLRSSSHRHILKELSELEQFIFLNRSESQVHAFFKAGSGMSVQLCKIDNKPKNSTIAAVADCIADSAVAVLKVFAPPKKMSVLVSAIHATSKAFTDKVVSAVQPVVLEPVSESSINFFQNLWRVSRSSLWNAIFVNVTVEKELVLPELKKINFIVPNDEKVDLIEQRDFALKALEVVCYAAQTCPEKTFFWVVKAELLQAMIDAGIIGDLGLNVCIICQGVASDRLKRSCPSQMIFCDFDSYSLICRHQIGGVEKASARCDSVQFGFNALVQEIISKCCLS